MKFSRGDLGLALPSAVSPIRTGHQAPGSSPYSNPSLASDCSRKAVPLGTGGYLLLWRFPEGSPTLGLQQPLPLLLEKKILSLDGNLGSKAHYPSESGKRRETTEVWESGRCLCYSAYWFSLPPHHLGRVWICAQWGCKLT